MKKFVCTVCGYVHEGDSAPEACPVCKAPAEKFKEQTGDREWAAEHVVGVAQGVSEDILADLRANQETSACPAPPSFLEGSTAFVPAGAALVRSQLC